MHELKRIKYIHVCLYVFVIAASVCVIGTLSTNVIHGGQNKTRNFL